MSDDLKLALTEIQKRALFKLAVDLVKADKQIHRDEVALLDRLQRTCGIDAGDLEFIHYISLQQAINCLKGLPERDKREVLAVLESVVGVDNDIDSRENMLLAAVRLTLEDFSHNWAMVVSASDIEAECSSEQIVYLERSEQSEASSVLNDKYDYLLLTKALGDVGLQLFYLPNVVGQLESQWGDRSAESVGFDLLRRSMEFIVPVGDRSRLADLSSTLAKMDSKTFFKVVCARFNMEMEAIPYNGFLMVKIGENYLLEDDGRLSKMVDFLCIDISTCVKQRILHFVKQLERAVDLIHYQGYYRLLYDYLSSEAKIVSSLVIDHRGDFRLADLENVRLCFESAPQAKSFYLLLLKYGRAGVSQQCFDRALEYLNDMDIDSGNFSVEEVKQQLMSSKNDWAKLIYNLVVIYEQLSTKDSGKSSFMNYISKIIQHRSALKNYVNTGFAEVHHLANAERYTVKFDKSSKSYYVELPASLVYVEQNNATTPLAEHNMWLKLIK